MAKRWTAVDYLINQSVGHLLRSSAAVLQAHGGSSSSEDEGGAGRQDMRARFRNATTSHVARGEPRQPISAAPREPHPPPALSKRTSYLQRRRGKSMPVLSDLLLPRRNCHFVNSPRPLGGCRRLLRRLRSAVQRYRGFCVHAAGPGP